MATYQKRGDKWRAIIRRVDYPTMSKTFPTKKLAEQWALSIEAPMSVGELEANQELKTIPVRALIRRYIDEITPTKKSAESERVRLEFSLKNFPHLFNKPISAFSKNDVVEWRDARLGKVKPSTVARDWGSLSAVFTAAKEVWGLSIKSNPFIEVKRPKNGKSRTRRISDDEIQIMLNALGWAEELSCKNHYVAWCFLFAIETAMRSGEILSLEWGDLDGRIAMLRDTKNGESRAVPLSSEARRLIDLLPRDGDFLVPLTATQRDSVWRDARDTTDIVDLRFHDTRHEALSRMAKLIANPMDLAKISGHKDLKILLNVYYNPTNEHLADLLG